MLLFRGQNEDTGFKPTKTRHDKLGGDNGAICFLGFERRSSALAYALTNYKIFEEDLDFMKSQNGWKMAFCISVSTRIESRKC
ncbi:hypothetical protein [Vibrio metschnikovii]|uniref:Uncharacterized protein n=1 Tax=Vibrio metschnikovii TaxID=28172 RepID=A0A9X0UMW5_VIBME|nr:hypothetical protein [Vibrio metschnikovii]MBC5851403.1 hypothetical protein [Vibrio metschnikovii]